MELNNYFIAIEVPYHNTNEASWFDFILLGFSQFVVFQLQLTEASRKSLVFVSCQGGETSLTHILRRA